MGNLFAVSDKRGQANVLVGFVETQNALDLVTTEICAECHRRGVIRPVHTDAEEHYESGNSGGYVAMSAVPSDGTATSREDKNGIPIRCGDLVLVTEHTAAYREVSRQDGWGREVPLCKHDQCEIPETVKISHGVVEYSEQFCAFRVRFTDRWPEDDFLFYFKEIEIVGSAGQ
jgi:hypothetical protein